MNILRDFVDRTQFPRGQWKRLTSFVEVEGETKEGEILVSRLDPRPILCGYDEWALHKMPLPETYDAEAGSCAILGHVIHRDSPKEDIYWESFTVWGGELVYNHYSIFTHKGIVQKGPGASVFNLFGLGFREDRNAEGLRELFDEYTSSPSDFPVWDVVEFCDGTPTWYADTARSAPSSSLPSSASSSSSSPSKRKSEKEEERVPRKPKTK
jgi:hypothetical protein